MLFSGVVAADVGTLPHVSKYQTVIPQRLKDLSLIKDTAAHVVISFTLQIEFDIFDKS